MSERPADLWRVFEARIRGFSNALAIRSPEGELSFGAIRSAAEHIANRLGEVGVGEGAVVGLSLSNTVDFAPALLAAFRCSATVALISPKYRASELQAIEDGINPACFVTGGAPGRHLQGELAAIGGEVTSVPIDDTRLSVLLPRNRDSTRRLVGNPAGLSPHALIKLTSGSTGVPKGIGLSASNLLAEAENVIATLGLSHDDQILAPVPLVHSYGFDLGLLPMLFGGTSLVVRDAFVPRRILGDLEQRETSVFLGIPSIYRTLVDIPVSVIPDLSHIRYLLSCTAPLRPELIAAFHKKFHVPICQHYGSSETGAVTTHSPDRVLDDPTSVGRPMRNVEVMVVDERGNEQPPNAEGEVVVSSGAVAGGYLMGAPPEESPFRDGAYWSGDLGFLNENGLLHLTGRKSEIINVGGLKVSPREVVDVLERHSAVEEAAVIGIESASGEEIVCAIVAACGPIAAEDILAYCRDNLADYKVPRRIEIRDELPRGATGKVKITAGDLGL